MVFYIACQIMELSGHPFFAAVQYHPEYKTRPMKPSPPYLGLLLASTGKLQTFLSKVYLTKYFLIIIYTHVVTDNNF